MGPNILIQQKISPSGMYLYMYIWYVQYCGLLYSNLPQEYDQSLGGGDQIFAQNMDEMMTKLYEMYSNTLPCAGTHFRLQSMSDYFFIGGCGGSENSDYWWGAGV